MTDQIKQPFQDDNSELATQMSQAIKATKELAESIGNSLKLVPETIRKDNMTQFEQVREFHKAFDCPAPQVPTELSDKLTLNRASFILEEVIELLYATAGDKERFDRFFAEFMLNAEKTYDKQLKKPFPEDRLIGQIDAFTDILYFANGGFVETGVIPDNIFRTVHAANMGKIFPDGKPHYNEVGKVVKPDKWEVDHAPEPKIQIEIDKQVELGAKRFE